MIESRYKIEYVLPDEEIKKSSPFRVLWYLLLIPLVLVAVTAITYDFSIKDIAKDSSILLEKAKVVIFNLEDSKQYKKPETTTNQLVEKILIPKPKKITKSQVEETVTKPVIVEKPDNSEEKMLISELTAKQEQQLKEIQEQIEKNKKLAQSLNSLSSELVLEKTRNDSLNTRLSEQEKDRLELEEQLNTALAEFEKNKQSIEQTIEQNAKTVTESDTVETTPKLTPEPKEIKVVKTEKIPENTKTPDSTKIEPTENIQSEAKQDNKELSATDKIIQAMSSADSEKPKETAIQDKPDTIKNSEVKETKTLEDAPDKPKNENNIVFALGVQNSEDIKIDDSLTSFTNNQQEEENKDKKEIKTKAVIKEPLSTQDNTVAEKPVTAIEPKEEPTPVEKPKATSQVDAIIAAMQQTQSNNSPESNQSIDPDLERDIKQQLVEQGDLSIDN